MKTIKYKKYRAFLISKCDVKKCKIASLVCQKCEHFHGMNGFIQEIRCDYKEDLHGLHELVEKFGY